MKIENFKFIGDIDVVKSPKTLRYRINRNRIRRSAGEILSDSKAEFSKTKTLDAGVRIFNGAVRTEREFPLKILFLACAQGFVVLIITRNGAEISRSRYPKGAGKQFGFLMK